MFGGLAWIGVWVPAWKPMSKVGFQNPTYFEYESKIHIRSVLHLTPANNEQDSCPNPAHQTRPLKILKQHKSGLIYLPNMNEMHFVPVPCIHVENIQHTNRFGFTIFPTERWSDQIQHRLTQLQQKTLFTRKEKHLYR